MFDVVRRDSSEGVLKAGRWGYPRSRLVTQAQIRRRAVGAPHALEDLRCVAAYFIVDRLALERVWGSTVSDEWADCVGALLDGCPEGVKCVLIEVVDGDESLENHPGGRGGEG